jgi:polysaccharide export outer membrane protein
MRLRIDFFAALLALGTGVVGFSQPAMAQEAVAAQEYVLGPGDVVEVSVLGREDFRTRTRVRPDGTILLPFLGEVAAGNRTTSELGQLVQTGLTSGGYYSNPVVSVEIVSYASRYITVLGSATSPGLVPIDRAYRLSEIIARVGGVREGAADYVVLTNASGEERRITIEELATGPVGNDPFVAPGDKVFVPKAEQFFIYGQVTSPGGYPIMSEPTLRKAVARGGGVTATGSHRKIKVYRKGQQVQLGLAEPIQPGDVIVVGERLF